MKVHKWMMKDPNDQKEYDVIVEYLLLQEKIAERSYATLPHLGKRHCLYCGRLIEAGGLDYHFGAHLENCYPRQIEGGKGTND